MLQKQLFPLPARWAVEYVSVSVDAESKSAVCMYLKLLTLRCLRTSPEVTRV